MLVFQKMEMNEHFLKIFVVKYTEFIYFGGEEVERFCPCS